jgi:hypothetical protein
MFEELLDRLLEKDAGNQTPQEPNRIWNCADCGIVSSHEIKSGLCLGHIVRPCNENWGNYIKWLIQSSRR